MGKTTRTGGPSGQGRVGNPVRPSNTVAAVMVSAPATDERPDTPQVVMWVGGATRPVNMDDTDLWFPGNRVVGRYSERPDLVAEMLAKSEFFVAHRGCGDEAPEHSYSSYLQSLGRGYEGVEISAQQTGDGSVICMHDTTLDRTTSLTGNVADFGLGQLQANVIDYGASVLGPGWTTSEPVPILGRVLSSWVHNGVVFLEPKAGATRVLAAATRFPECGKSIIWKFSRNADGSLPSHAQLAKAAGMRLWIYMTSGDSPSLIQTVAATLAGGGGAIGMDIADSDANITAAVATGVPVIVFAVRTRTERDRLRALGVQGYMCTNVSYVGNDTRGFDTDGFSTGVRRAGDFEGASNKLVTLTAATGSVALAQGTTATLSMGSMCPVPTPTGSYTIDYSMKWAVLPAATEHSDVYFGHADDRAYAHQASTNIAGYHAVFRANGQLQLFTHAAGTTTGTQIGSTVNTAAPVADTWMTFRITVTATQVTYQRLDDASATTTAASTHARGGYFGLASGSSSLVAQFKDITVA